MIAIQQQWPHAEIDFRDPAGVWGNAIDRLTTAQIKYGIEQLRNVTDRFAINAAQFRAMALRYTAPEKPAPRQIADSGERDVARRAANAAFCSRVCGRSVTQAAYHGGFDYMSVVNAAEVPPDSVKEHTMYWRRFWASFDQAWGEYVG